MGAFKTIVPKVVADGAGLITTTIYQPPDVSLRITYDYYNAGDAAVFNDYFGEVAEWRTPGNFINLLVPPTGEEIFSDFVSLQGWSLKSLPRDRQKRAEELLRCTPKRETSNDLRVIAQFEQAYSHELLSYDFEDHLNAARLYALKKLKKFYRNSHVICMAPSAILDDPTAPAHVRMSGVEPIISVQDLAMSISVRKVTLKDRITTATIIPFSNLANVPPGLLEYLRSLLNEEITKGDTYPMMHELDISTFGGYWFGSFAAVVVKGEHTGQFDMSDDRDWKTECLGSFYIKPNYPGRSSHVCNGGFLVTAGARNKGVGKLMGEAYIEWAPLLGYTYSVFNLVYSTNTASVRIWDSLGFKKIGKVPGAGALKSFPDEYTDAWIYGRELGENAEGIVGEDRFERIKYFLTHGKYPDESDRLAKSRLRSAQSSYEVVGDVLYHKNKNQQPKIVIFSQQEQYDIVKAQHEQGNGHTGINKTCAAVAATYHWTGIKSTTSNVIKNCEVCKSRTTDGVRRRRSPNPEGARSNSRGSAASPPAASQSPHRPTRAAARGRTRVRPEDAAAAQLQEQMNMINMQNQQAQMMPVQQQPQQMLMSAMYNIDPEIMQGVETNPFGGPGDNLAFQTYLAHAAAQANGQGMGYNVQQRDEAMVQAAQNALQQTNTEDHPVKDSLLAQGYGQNLMNYDQS